MLRTEPRPLTVHDYGELPEGPPYYQSMWIFDPELRQLQVYHLQKSADLPVATYSGKQKFASALFPGLKLQIGKIFQS
jgi:Uma2 family endonuclease